MAVKHCIDCGAVITNRQGILCSDCAMAGNRPIAPIAQSRVPTANRNVAPVPPHQPVPPPQRRGLLDAIWQVQMVGIRFLLLFIMVILGFGVTLGLYARYQDRDKEKQEDYAATPPTPRQSVPSKSSAAVSAPASTNQANTTTLYQPLSAYPYEPRTPWPTESSVIEGQAPNTPEELRQAINENPNSNMAKAQQFYMREDGQHMWRYTETRNVDPKIEVQRVTWMRSIDGSGIDGSVLLRNASPFPIMDVQIVMDSQGQTAVMCPPMRSNHVVIPSGQEVSVPIHGPYPPSIQSAVLRVEAQLNGPPGLLSLRDIPLPPMSPTGQ